MEPSVALALPLVLKGKRRAVLTAQLTLVTGNEALVNELITRHAPEVRLHREEQYYPCSIEWYLRMCELCYDGKQGKHEPRPPHLTSPHLPCVQ